MASFPLKVLAASNKCITFELSIENKVCCFTHLYGTISQTQVEFEMFKSNLK